MFLDLVSQFILYVLMLRQFVQGISYRRRRSFEASHEENERLRDQQVFR